MHIIHSNYFFSLQLFFPKCKLTMTTFSNQLNALKNEGYLSFHFSQNKYIDYSKQYPHIATCCHLNMDYSSKKLCRY